MSRWPAPQLTNLLDNLSDSGRGALRNDEGKSEGLIISAPSRKARLDKEEVIKQNLVAIQHLEDCNLSLEGQGIMRDLDLRKEEMETAGAGFPARGTMGFIIGEACAPG